MTYPRRTLSLIGVLLILVVFWLRSGNPRSGKNPGLSGDFLTNALQTLARFEEQEARKFWGAELQAVAHGGVLEQLWDDLNTVTNRFEVLARCQLNSITLGKYVSKADLPHGIRVLKPSAPKEVLDAAGWRSLLEDA